MVIRFLTGLMHLLGLALSRGVASAWQPHRRRRTRTSSGIEQEPMRRYEVSRLADASSVVLTLVVATRRIRSGCPNFRGAGRFEGPAIRSRPSCQEANVFRQILRG